MKVEMFLLALVVLPIAFVSGCVADSEIDSFEDCIAAGYPALESYPRQCNTPDGKHFVENIGGQRDENGCLGPAGYTWNESVKACIREWELNESQKEAAKTAVSYIGQAYATTITQIVDNDCENCFIVELEQGLERDVLEVTVSNNSVEQASIVRHVCSEEEKQSEICTMEYLPVCGFKNEASKNYGNGCMACADGVDYWEYGECEKLEA